MTSHLTTFGVCVFAMALPHQPLPLPTIHFLHFFPPTHRSHHLSHPFLHPSIYIGIAWLKDKAKEEGVVTLDSGLLYKIVTSSESGKTPTVSTPCACHYRGTLMNGNEFDSSYKRGSPTTFAPNQVIKGWTEAMQLMKEGDKWELFIPSELAYGDRGAGGSIPGGAPLIFTLEMIEVKGPGKEL